MAEELAEIDLISRGRLVTGWVRGAGSEQFFNNANPAYNREYFNEAHDFIIQAWTRPGPWRYEGKHFHYRHVNPWALPYQKPHPQIWIPGVLSPETVRWCAEHRYPYVGLGTALGPTCELWDIYADEAAKHGYQAGPENFGYLVPTFLAETEEKAQELGKGFVYGGGQNAFSRPEHTLPPGYNSKSAIKMLAKHPGGSWLGVSPDKLRQAQQEPDTVEETDYDEVRRKLAASYQKAQKNLQVLIGTPKSVLPKIRTLLQVLRPGIFTVFNVQGPVRNADRMTSMRLLATEIIPVLREYAKELALPDPYMRTPGAAMLQSGVTRAPVVDRGPLASLGLV
jgi:alkanesulfonate monooxygenase SsuD/methylene tetrahydromethanopterin reductase-like flavin-dependent oxidoreductase (luciferase family)